MSAFASKLNVVERNRGKWKLFSAGTLKLFFARLEECTFHCCLQTSPPFLLETPLEAPQGLLCGSRDATL